MHSETGRRRTVINAAEPQLFVTDMRLSLAFYTERLGFEVAFSHGDPVFYAQVVRDAGRQNLRSVDGAVFAAGFRARVADALSATMTPDDANPCFSNIEKLV